MLLLTVAQLTPSPHLSMLNSVTSNHHQSRKKQVSNSRDKAARRETAPCSKVCRISFIVYKVSSVNLNRSLSYLRISIYLRNPLFEFKLQAFRVATFTLSCLLVLLTQQIRVEEKQQELRYIALANQSLEAPRTEEAILQVR